MSGEGIRSSSSFHDRLRQLPKAELHVHLDGSVRPTTMLEEAASAGVRLPRADAAELADYMHVRDARDLVEYLSRFEITLSIMQSADALERIAFELAADLALEQTRYVEVRFSPILHTRRGLAREEVVEATLRGLHRAEEELGIRTGLIICAMRQLDPEVSLELAELALAYSGQGVVGFDLAGPEAGYPPERHRAAFERVRAGDLAVTIHAGEAYGPASIRQAVHLCGARRIGHGTFLEDDPRMLDYLRDSRIPIEICLTSNVQTRAVHDFEEHPLRRYFNAGLLVNLNTDNRLMSATTLTEEYWRAHRHLGFGWAELVRIALMGFAAAFLPWPEKQELIARVKAEIARLPGGDSGGAEAGLASSP